MRIFVVLICSLALACAAYSAQQEENKPQKKKQAKTAQQAAPSTGQSAGAKAGSRKPSMGAYEGQRGRKGQTQMGAYEGQKGKKGQTQMGAYEGQKGKKGQASVNGYQGQKGKKGQASAEAYQGQKGKKTQTSRGAYVGQPGKPGKRAKVTGATAATGKPFKPQHFNVSKQPNTAKAPSVKFQQGRHIKGSQNWQGANYTVFRTYRPVWHDRGWWNGHYNRTVFVFGGWYYWNAGWWYPAWGYAPNAYYAYDGPIYGYNDLPPDQVIANVQAALQQQGYYHGEVDGLLGPLTREAIAGYQRDRGLYETAAIDRPTLESLGMA
jgi:hypothetical protein